MMEYDHRKGHYRVYGESLVFWLVVVGVVLAAAMAAPYLIPIRFF